MTMTKEARIVINLGDEPPEQNSTLLALLRDGEKFKPGDPRGTLADRLGAVFRDFMANQVRAADYKRAAVKGEIVLTFAFTTGPDGSQSWTCVEKVKPAKLPSRTSMAFTDTDGELTGRPVEPLTEEMYKRESAAKGSADPTVGAASRL